MAFQSRAQTCPHGARRGQDPTEDHDCTPAKALRGRDENVVGQSNDEHRQGGQLVHTREGDRAGQLVKRAEGVDDARWRRRGNGGSGAIGESGQDLGKSTPRVQYLRVAARVYEHEGRKEPGHDLLSGHCDGADLKGNFSQYAGMGAVVDR